ncbi:uncharacterized protein LACBIDRAFT_300053 [Laccaria bicolor S238N-H82]|uniref:Predicted protein n=1 Tax=Laccaria bicolor (strain S238N-H82 / ATCC MYA-4686) TaxID=486041 RepID=B0DFY0_LACBS|nr:uncharacterized protein LACBIDRAFT_300053 [Laccaria bicolor S238N-H82]EDR06421.1 predicted protein [Laccaria bicolor S238N-H82]|eukprot:XP_001882793.1 predicted protein [Laccaria bicolor S238N-H82]
MSETHSPKKRQVELASTFIDLEAVVDVEEDDNDPDEEMLLSEFAPQLTILIPPIDDLIDNEEPDNNETGAQWNLLREFDSRGGDIDAGWQSFMERAHIRSVDDKSHSLPDYQGPRTDDYRLYEITCPIGKEETTIFQILQAFVNWSTVSPPVRSAIAHNCHPG